MTRVEKIAKRGNVHLGREVAAFSGIAIAPVSTKAGSCTSRSAENWQY